MQDNLSHRFRGRMFVQSEEYENTRRRIEEGFVSNENYLSFLSQIKLDENFERNLVTISAAAIIADGEHQEDEAKIVNEICNEFRLDKEVVNNRINEELKSFTSTDYPIVKKYLKKSMIISDNTDYSLLFETAMHIILSDGIMTISECNLLADIGEMLNIPTAQILARLSLFLRKEETILVDVEEQISWHSLSGISE